MAFQFAHVETYSIKGSQKKSGGAGIAAEAGRTPANSRHVENPKPPVLLAGIEPELAWLNIVESHGKARDLWTQKSGVKAERKLRTDAHILLAAVASHPEPTATCDTDSPAFQDWLKRSIAFFTKEHGEPLSVVMHLDETHPHIHFLTAPDLEGGQRMHDIHVGEKAKEDVGGKFAKKYVKEKAFGDVMRIWQDRYQESVGAYHGLARLGPRLRRLPNDSYKAEQAEAKRRAEQLLKLETQTQIQTTQQTQLDQREQVAAEASAALDAAEADLAARAAATAAALAQIDEIRRDLENREIAVDAAEIEVNQVKVELSEREQTVAQAQAQVAEAQNDLEARETAVTAAQREVRKAQKTLNVKTEKFRNAKAELNERVVHVSQREQRLAGVWGAFVSAVTLGKAGTKRRVETAVEAVKADFAGKLTESMADLEKAEQAHEKATQRLESENRSLEEQNMTLTGAVSAAERTQRQAQEKTQELAEKLGPMEATNAELKAARDSLAALVDDIEAAVAGGDLETVSELLNRDSGRPELAKDGFRF
jgi:hypothetical protein